MFAQPFLASGKYSSFKEFAEVKSRRMFFFGRDNGSTVVTNTDAQTGAKTGYTIDPDGAGAAAPFTFDNPDFNLRSLRGTGVLQVGVPARLDDLFRLDPGAGRLRPVRRFQLWPRPLSAIPGPADERLPDQGHLLDRPVAAGPHTSRRQKRPPMGWPFYSGTGGG